MARNVRFPEGEIEVSEEFSNRDFTRYGSVINIPDGSVVYGSCFSQEVPNTPVFNPAMRNVTFRNCNLSNVRVPQPNNNVLIDCRVDQFQAQNDLNDWIVDDLGKPVEILNKAQFIKLGLPLPLPSNIPLTRVTERVDLIEAAQALVV